MARASCRLPSGFLRHVLRHYPDLPTAVTSARRDAHPGDTILLAPGCTSYDQFPSYGARGDAFRAPATAL